MMMGGLRHVPWDDPAEAIPAFLTVILMPLAFSITEGVAFGLVSYAGLQSGRRAGPGGPSAGVCLRGALHRPICVPPVRAE